MKENLESNTKKKSAFSATQNIVLIGLLASALTVGKLALSFVPNVEIVTLLILVYSTVFGKKVAIPATMIFCTIEVFLYGFSTWVILYFIHWNTLALFASIFLKKPKIVIAIIYAVVMTFFFGVLDTLINTIFAGFGGVPTYQLLNLFIAYYIKGGWFYFVHILSNAIVVGALYPQLVKTLQKIKPEKEKSNL